MKKLAVISSILALMSGSALAAGPPAPTGSNFNFASVFSHGELNQVEVLQGGYMNVNGAMVFQHGKNNLVMSTQGGVGNVNLSNAMQFGKDNVTIISQH